MPLSATISINVPTLPDSDTWFANAAAFNNFFTGLTGVVDIIPAANTTYVPSAYVVTSPALFTIDGVDYVVPTNTMFASLLAAYTALNTNYQNLLVTMQAAGLIQNSI